MSKQTNAPHGTCKHELVDHVLARDARTLHHRHSDRPFNTMGTSLLVRHHVAMAVAMMEHDPDDLSAWRAIRVALGLAPRPDMTPPGRLRRALIARRLGLRCLVCNRRAGYGGVCPNPKHNG